MAASFLREHRELQPFLLQNARPTGIVIGDGSYGSVVEVEIPGAKCAAKKIHDFFQDPTRMPREGIEKASREFVRECQLTSTLRHPHIVQFLGVCFLPGSRMPALVMEELLTGLHEVLDPEPPPRTKAYIPLSLKCSILHDVASGLSFLHGHTPPIIHRDLSARNILLSVGMVAKIADLGMARIVPSLRAATMTKAPGASIYMPPEALEDVSKYDVTIDIFSIGVLAIFTLSQTFPKPLAAAYMDARRRMIGRTELERRGNYMQQIQRQLREDHPLIKMIQRCLSNLPEERPTTDLVLQFLEQARGEVNDRECDMSKLALVQALSQKTQLLQTNQELVEQKMREIQTKDEQIESQQEQIESQQEQIESQQKQIGSQQKQIGCMGRQIQAQQAKIPDLQRKLQPSDFTHVSADALSSCSHNSNEVESAMYAQPYFHRNTASTHDSNAIYSEPLQPSDFTQVSKQQPEQTEEVEDLRMYSSIYTVATSGNDTFHQTVEITSDNISELRELGTWQFGKVVLAQTYNLSLKDMRMSERDDNRNISIYVAVKKMRSNPTSTQREAFDKEIKFMSRLNHPNVVLFLGVCYREPSFIIMEYMEKGDLSQFLQQYSDIVPTASDDSQLATSIVVHMATQIASGMRYLASKNFVHRDLASRNCLVGNRFIVKLGNFGMSRNLYESHYYRIHGNAVLPIRWMPTECFYGMFSEKTDAWAFGITMWELFTLAKDKPYPDLNDSQVVEDAVNSGPHRKIHPRPSACPQPVYEVMLQCWAINPKERATFQVLHEMLQKLPQDF